MEITVVLCGMITRGSYYGKPYEYEIYKPEGGGWQGRITIDRNVYESRSGTITEEEASDAAHKEAMRIIDSLT
jgi:hypothetical protein